MSFLNQVKGLFVNGQKVADIEKDSVMVICVFITSNYHLFTKLSFLFLSQHTFQTTT